jgi:hypothetical protein
MTKTTNGHRLIGSSDKDNIIWFRLDKFKGKYSTYNDVHCLVSRYPEQYGHGAALSLFSSQNEPLLTATVNLHPVMPADDCVFIKAYSANEGVDLELMRHHLIEPTGRFHPTGYVVVQEYQMIGQFLECWRAIK